MARHERSLLLTDAYRDRLRALTARVEQTVTQRWGDVRLEDFEPSFGDWLGAASTAVAGAQTQAVRLSTGYLTAFLSSELGRGVRTVSVDGTRLVGRSRDGRSLAEAYDSPRIGVLVAKQGGEGNDTALKAGLVRALRMVELDTMHAGRTALLEGIEGDERFEGWQRALRGTCGACAGVASGVSHGLRFQVHPGCQCVSEPVVGGLPNVFPRPTGAEIFAAKSEDEQNEMLGPEAAERVRQGDVSLADLVAQSHLASDQDDWITQRPVSAL